MSLRIHSCAHPAGGLVLGSCCGPDPLPGCLEVRIHFPQNRNSSGMGDGLTGDKLGLSSKAGKGQLGEKEDNMKQEQPSFRMAREGQSDFCG